MPILNFQYPYILTFYAQHPPTTTRQEPNFLNYVIEAQQKRNLIRTPNDLQPYWKRYKTPNKDGHLFKFSRVVTSHLPYTELAENLADIKNPLYYAQSYRLLRTGNKTQKAATSNGDRLMTFLKTVKL